MTWFGIGAALGGGMAIGDALGSALGGLLSGGQSCRDVQARLEEERKQRERRAIAEWKSKREVMADPDRLLDEKIRQYIVNFPEIGRISPEFRLTNADWDRFEQRYPEYYQSRFGRL